MELERGVFCARCKLLLCCHGDARLVVFPNLAIEVRLVNVELEDFVDFLHHCHQRDDFTQGRRERNVLALGCTYRDFTLEGAPPVNGASSIFDDISILEYRFSVSCGSD